MVNAKTKHDLDGAAIIASTVVNVNRRKGASPVSPLSFHPYRKEKPRGVRLTRENLKSVATAIVSAYKR